MGTRQSVGKLAGGCNYLIGLHFQLSGGWGLVAHAYAGACSSASEAGTNNNMQRPFTRPFNISCCVAAKKPSSPFKLTLRVSQWRAHVGIEGVSCKGLDQVSKVQATYH